MNRRQSHAAKTRAFLISFAHDDPYFFHPLTLTSLMDLQRNKILYTALVPFLLKVFVLEMYPLERHLHSYNIHDPYDNIHDPYIICSSQ